MSEQQPLSPETHLINPEIGKEVQESLTNHAEAADNARHEHQEHIGEIRQAVEQKAISGKEISLAENANTSPQPAFINRELQRLSFNRNLIRIRKRLSPVEKAASKLIHQPVVHKISEISEETIARPSGLLGGGILGLVGSSLLLYMAKHYGFEYNYLAFFILFAAGFALGLLTELVTKLARR
jgi:hypothetical protein